MLLDLSKYDDMLKAHNVNITYSGPMWEEGLKGIASIVENRLATEDISANAAKAVFSVFIEQVTNMLMYSAQKEKYCYPNKEPAEVSSGTLLIGSKDSTYFVQTGNAIRKESMELIKRRLDFLNSLDKKELRKFHREQLNADNDNPKSKGAGLGFIEIARRATSPIFYNFDQNDDYTTYFSMYVEVAQDKKKEDL